MTGTGIDESEIEKLIQEVDEEEMIPFQTEGEAYRKERSVIFKESKGGVFI